MKICMASVVESPATKMKMKSRCHSQVTDAAPHQSDKKMLLRI